MKLSEIQSAFAKVAQLVGDVEVTIAHDTDEVETEFKGISVLLNTVEGVDKSAVTLLHGAPSTPEPAPVESAA